MEVVGEETITYRASVWSRIVVFVLGGGCAVVGVIVGLDPVAPDSQRGGGWALALFGLWLVIRAPRVGLHADRGGMVVRGWFTSRRFTWDQVRTVSPGMSSVVSRSNNVAYTLVIERTDGSSFPVDCLAGTAQGDLGERAAALRCMGGLDPIITTAAQPSLRRWLVYFALLILVPVAFGIAMSAGSDRPSRGDFAGDLPDFDADAGDYVSVVLTDPPLVEVVDCGPDAVRLLAVIDLDTSSPYPGRAALRRQGNERCPPDTGRVLVPTAASWAEDDGAVYCLERP